MSKEELPKLNTDIENLQFEHDYYEATKTLIQTIRLMKGSEKSIANLIHNVQEKYKGDNDVDILYIILSIYNQIMWKIEGGLHRLGFNDEEILSKPLYDVIGVELERLKVLDHFLFEYRKETK